MPDTIISRNFLTKTSAQNTPADVHANPGITNVGNLALLINQITVVRRADLRAAHWELFLGGVGGEVVKVDLMEAGYRVLYGATIPLGGRCNVGVGSAGAAANPWQHYHRRCRICASQR